ncbi:MAG TPA: DUF4394 domain-containing protein [Bacteroidia bacterium]|nr:DUF4394 domain-containing protein [Bacteroidia bacterium]
MKKITLYGLASISLVILTTTACKKELDDQAVPLTQAQNERFGGGLWGRSNTVFYVLANGNQLDKYNSNYCYNNSPSPSNSTTISGLPSGVTILAIDFRPSTGQLYGLGSNNSIYVINPETGTSRMIGATPFTPSLSGTIAAFDFNPTVDRIRVVTSTGQNIRLNPETGSIAAVDGNINGATGAAISSVAYNNNFSGATTTTLFDIDPATDKLYRQDPPNNGTLISVGPLNIDVQGEGGFDISPKGAALAIYAVNNVSTLLEINLTNGNAEVKATFPGVTYTAIAIPTASVAYAVSSSNELLIFGLQPYIGYGGFFNNNTITKPITGIPAGESILGMDMRPLNGQIYALGSNSNIYTINPASAIATLAYALTTPLSGTSFGFDFNPTVDRIRIVSNTGQNLRFNPNDGLLTVDLNLNPGTPSIVAAAYDNNFAGTTTTSLFAIDNVNNKLYQMNPPNNGTLVEIGSLGVNVPSASGFDIGGTSNNAYAIFKTGYINKIFRVNTATGNVFYTGLLGTSTINGFTVGLGF